MIKLLGKIPRTLLTIAVSGGPDSMAALDFLRRNNEVQAVFVDHGTEASSLGKKVCIDYCHEKDILLHIKRIDRQRDKTKSKEEFWRHERYKFFSEFDRIVTAHHLNDCIETWIFTSLHGKPQLIPYERDNIIRPFLLNPKKELVDWCLKKGVNFIHDASNDDDAYMRNHIRRNILPLCLKVNPGLNKTMIKKIKGEFA